MSAKLLQFPVRAPKSGPVALAAAPSGAVRSREQIIESFRTGSYPEDAEFDSFLPEAAKPAADQHWTPVRVAARAAQWLDEVRARRVLDIGSGAGKFCVAAALAGRCELVGLEHRAPLVDAARSLAEHFGVGARVTFIQGALGAVSIPSADAYYLYNPFEENLSGSSERIALSAELSAERYARDVAATYQLLAGACLGSFVLVYNGFGSELPPGYRQVRAETDLPHPLRLWKKTSWVPSGPR
jgi:SAM-dependent methyltransferase